MGSATAAASTACAWPTHRDQGLPADRPPRGTWFDVDFNPAANRLRGISDRGQNLRHNLDDPTGPPTRGHSGRHRPDHPPATEVTSGVTGAAYHNNDGDPDTATTLFTLECPSSRRDRGNGHGGPDWVRQAVERRLRRCGPSQVSEVRADQI